MHDSFWLRERPTDDSMDQSFHVIFLLLYHKYTCIKNSPKKNLMQTWPHSKMKLIHKDFTPVCLRSQIRHSGVCVFIIIWRVVFERWAPPPALIWWSVFHQLPETINYLIALFAPSNNIYYNYFKDLCTQRTFWRLFVCTTANKVSRNQKVEITNKFLSEQNRTKTHKTRTKRNPVINSENSSLLQCYILLSQGLVSGPYDIAIPVQSDLVWSGPRSAGQYL